MLAVVACVNLSLLFSGRCNWQLLPLPGALVRAPFVVGPVTVGAVLTRAGQGGFRLAPRHRPVGRSQCGRRDDYRFWKVSLLYVNRDDPALLVAARIGAGWTVNLANPAAWLLITAVIAAPPGLAAILAALGHVPG